MKYTFNYFTGYGYREISSHTIQFCPININALSDQEAIEKVIKKAKSLNKYNNCYSIRDRIPVICNDKIGLYFINKGIIVWEASVLYWGFPAIVKTDKLQSFTLPSCEYKYYDHNWTQSYCVGHSIYLSIDDWNNYCNDYLSKSKI